MDEPGQKKQGLTRARAVMEKECCCHGHTHKDLMNVTLDHRLAHARTYEAILLMDTDTYQSAKPFNSGRFSCDVSKFHATVMPLWLILLKDRSSELDNMEEAEP